MFDEEASLVSSSSSFLTSVILGLSVLSFNTRVIP
jgi:hypothetical protein